MPPRFVKREGAWEGRSGTSVTWLPVRVLLGESTGAMAGADRTIGPSGSHGDGDVAIWGNIGRM